MMVNLQNILLWEEDEVLEFLSALGYPGYGDQIRAEGITGELLIHCNHEALKDIGIHSVVRRNRCTPRPHCAPLFLAGQRGREWRGLREPPWETRSSIPHAMLLTLSSLSSLAGPPPGHPQGRLPAQAAVGCARRRGALGTSV